MIGGLTIVLITHEMHVIRKICHRVVVMEDGQVGKREKQRIPIAPAADYEKVPQITDSTEIKENIAHIKGELPTGTLTLFFVGESTEQPALQV